MLLFWALTAVTVSLPSLRYNVSSEGGHVLQFQPAGFGGGANRSLANRRVLWLSAKLPNDGCAESPAPAPGDWVALVNRGDCHFSFKAVKAEAAGACAVIIVDTAGGDNQAQRFPFTMCPYPGDAEVNIPVMLVAHTAGALLAKFAQDAAWANITIPPFTMLQVEMNRRRALGVSPSAFSPLSAGRALDCRSRWRHRSGLWWCRQQQRCALERGLR